MYGTVGRIKIKPDRLNDTKQVIREIEKVPGVIDMSLVSKDDSMSDYYWIIWWSDKTAHDANSNRAEFPATYQRLLNTLAVDPEWHSGEIVYAISR